MGSHLPTGSGGTPRSSTGLVETAQRVFNLPVLAKRQIELVRGDRGYGNEKFMAFLEGRSQPFILKVRQPGPCGPGPTP